MEFIEKGSPITNFVAFTLNKAVESRHFHSVFLPFASTEGRMEEGSPAFVLLIYMRLLYCSVLDKQ